jgi:hypothetical protein
MKRLAVVLGMFVLATQIAGCGGGGSTTEAVTGPAVKNSENPNLPPEVREFEARQEAQVTKAMEKQNQKNAK